MSNLHETRGRSELCGVLKSYYGLSAYLNSIAFLRDIYVTQNNEATNWLSVGFILSLYQQYDK
jgi:hypothetical protein